MGHCLGAFVGIWSLHPKNLSFGLPGVFTELVNKRDIELWLVQLLECLL